ncbi:hypothetical protein [Saccharothrix sp. ALI-22-I]|uniref:hypothetical protein n=1 Tax=Saccharothrix sp. ALI-22-I TaxID=1933778 RepID=UPI0019310596|nr:hypothetical protein [Saccharothrix sp. ALI-22-I]
MIHTVRSTVTAGISRSHTGASDAWTFSNNRNPSMPIRVAASARSARPCGSR